MHDYTDQHTVGKMFDEELQHRPQNLNESHFVNSWSDFMMFPELAEQQCSTVIATPKPQEFTLYQN